MKIQNNLKYYNPIYPKTITSPNFRGGIPVQTLTHTNIGMAADGIIGKVRLFTPNGKEMYLNVMKNTFASGKENYQIKDNVGRMIGEIDFKINKFNDFNVNQCGEDPSHVFVELLRNYSNPKTKYYKQGLTEYKEVGTRLMQIAQRRSDETRCCGNIQLYSKNNAINFYEKIGFIIQPSSMCGFEDNITRMYLPPLAKEPLSKRSGGL